MPESVLLVDDDRHFRETLTDALSLRKVDVQEAGTGADALKIMEDEIPALILLDVQLPDMNGFDLCRIFKRSDRLKKVPVVMLSAAFTEPADRVEGLLAGAEAYLSKPLSLDSLWEEMQYLLDRPQ